MSAVPARDWLAELHGAVEAKDVDRLSGVLAEISRSAPRLAGEACGIVAELGAEWEPWAKKFFVPAATVGVGGKRFIPPERKSDFAASLDTALLRQQAPAFIAKVAAEQPVPRAEPKRREFEEEPEAEGVVDDESNAASDVFRKLWRIKGALDFISAHNRGWLEHYQREIASLLMWMSKGNVEIGLKIFGDLFNCNPNPDPFGAVRGKSFIKAEVVYREAQRLGWRYPITQNLNRLEEMIGQTEQALIRVGAPIYQRTKRLVRPVQLTVEAAAPFGSKKPRKTTVTTLEPIGEGWLKPFVTRYVNYVTWKRHDRPEGVGVPKDLVSGMLSRYDLTEFPTVTGIITAPTLRPDGSILDKEGWDAATGLLLMQTVRMPSIADEPTKDDARMAVKLLEGLLAEFPFVGAASKSGALSGLMSPVVRGALKCAPGHAASAPEAGTGKSYLWDIAAGIAIGAAMPIIARGSESGELDKRIDAQVFSGIPIWSLDNVSAPIGGDALCQAIERPSYTARVLAKSEVRTLRNIWTIYITGNNLRIKNDATRRILQICLDAAQEKPEQRKFKRDPYADVLADRGRYLWAVLTVVRAYIVAGMPGRLPWVGEPFGAWSDLVRSALVWLDYADPYTTTETTRASDPDRQTRSVMLHAILAAYGTEERTAKQMLKDAEAASIQRAGASVKLLDTKTEPEAENLKTAIENYLGGRNITAQHLGNKLATDQGRITDGLKLRAQQDSHSKINYWHVERVNEPST